MSAAETRTLGVLILVLTIGALLWLLIYATIEDVVRRCLRTREPLVRPYDWLRDEELLRSWDRDDRRGFRALERWLAGGIREW